MVEAQRQAAGTAAAAQESMERRLDDDIAALAQSSSQRLTATRKHECQTKAHRVGRKRVASARSRAIRCDRASVVSLFIAVRKLPAVESVPERINAPRKC
jgi:hypothetical protein